MRWMLFAVVAVFPVAAEGATSLSTSVWDAPAAVDPAGVPMPNISFTPTPSDIDSYQKYFIFHRDQTSFETAYADLDECDNYASGRPNGPQMDMTMMNAMQNSMMSQYGVIAGGAGGIIGGMIAGAIIEAQMAADRRKLRRGIMRTCMGFKGYSAFGLAKSLWTEFNFEEGWRQTGEERRMHLLRLQAKVASGPRPTVGELR